MATNRSALINIIWRFIKTIKADRCGSGVDIMREDIESSVLSIDDELRISGEEANNFSMFYVNYYELPERATQMMNYLTEHNYLVDWYNPAYIIATKEEK